MSRSAAEPGPEAPPSPPQAPASSGVGARLTDGVALAVGLGFTAFVCRLKLGSLAAWRYTSDLFTYDQVLAETLSGHFGLEYTYGNTFGDHAYPFLLLLLPLRLLLAEQTVVALLLLAPLAHLAGAVAAVALARRSGADAHTSLVAGLVLLFSPGILEGLYHARYGAHPMDELAGPLAIAAALLLRQAAGGRSGAPALAAVLAFASLKEEMAVLGIVMTCVLLLFERSSLARRALIACSVVLVAEVALMQASVTPFNDRTMGSDVADLVERLGSGSLGALAAAARPGTLPVLGGLLAALGMAVAVARRADPFAAALFAAGGAKIALAALVRRDLDLSTWHNYPAVVMLTGAVFVQLTATGVPRLGSRVASWVFLAAVAGSFLHSQVPYARRQLAANAAGLPLAAEYRSSLEDVAARIEAEAVVAVPPVTAAAWTRAGHHRFTFYPRGVEWSPRGIADYLVLQSRQVRLRSYYTPPRSRREIELDHPEFRLIHRNPHFFLLKRTGWTPESRASRLLWVEHFGPTSLGTGNLWVEDAPGPPDGPRPAR